MFATFSSPYQFSADYQLLDDFMLVYRQAYGREPTAYALGFGWFLINGNMTQRTALIENIQRLRLIDHEVYLAERQKIRLLRLISKIRNL